MSTNGQEQESIEDLFAGMIEPVDIPDVTRGHFAVLMGQLVAMKLCYTLLVMQQLNEHQRSSLQGSFDRLIELTESALRERKVRGQDLESIFHAEGCLAAFQDLRSRLAH